MASPAELADVLFKAMKGLGTDEDALIRVLGHHTRAEIQKVAAEYENRHKKNLQKDLISETGGHFRDVLVALLSSPFDYAAELVEKAVKGTGTNEAMLIDVVAPLTSEELAELKREFARLYGRQEGALAERIMHDVSTSSDFGKLLQAVLEGHRTSDPSKVEQEAESLFKAGEGKLGTDEARFISVFAYRTPEHLKAVSQAYERKHGHKLTEAVKRETSGDFQHLLISLTLTRAEFFALRVRDAIDGLGTNDSLLIRCFGLNDKPQLQEIGRTFRRMYNKSIEEEVKGDISGDYRKICIALLEK